MDVVQDKQSVSVVIKPMQTDAEMEGKAYVHWQAWQQAYADIVDAGYLANHTLAKCIQVAHRWPDDILVAKDGDRVIGFAGYGACQDEDLPGAGEVFALYILREYYGTGVGRALMEAALLRLESYADIAVWVLADNARAIRFYEKCGFCADGMQKQLTLGAPVTVRRMVLQKR